VPIPVPPDVSEEEVQEAADAAAEALPEDTEAVVGERDPEPEPSPEPDDMQRTIEQLRSTGDPNEVERTPVLASGNIDVAPDEWELGFPLQGIPRLAAVLNLNYVYNEQRERWERQEPFEDTAVGAPAARLEDANTASVGGFGNLDVTYKVEAFARQVEADASAGTITAPTDGIYRVTVSQQFDNYNDGLPVFLRIEVNDDTERQLEKNLKEESGGGGSEVLQYSTLVQLTAGDVVNTRVTNFGNSSVTVDDGDTDTYLSLQKV